VIIFIWCDRYVFRFFATLLTYYPFDHLWNENDKYELKSNDLGNDDELDY
jgi:hypothetical protein